MASPLDAGREGGTTAVATNLFVISEALLVCTRASNAGPTGPPLKEGSTLRLDQFVFGGIVSNRITPVPEAPKGISAEAMTARLSSKQATSGRDGTRVFITTCKSRGLSLKV